ncbi:MAG TPA: inorganic diphosphatase [Nitrososphaeraceae archaeon]|nr:inorganic diphosphatase [Nitrososphaeraceae archaeon]
MSHNDLLPKLSIVDKISAMTEPQGDINVVVEIPKDSSIKYELDHQTGVLFVDRKLYTSMVYPFNYGFLPGTLEEDGDPVDVLLLGEESLFPLSVIHATPLGVLLTEDEEGKDSKIIAIPTPKVDPAYSNIKQISDIPASILDKVKHFFEHYKELEPGKFVKVVGYANKQVARQKIKEAADRYSARNHQRALN